MADIDLNLIMTQLQRVQTEQAFLRAEIRVVNATVQRLDVQVGAVMSAMTTMMSAVLDELRAIHALLDRMAQDHPRAP